MEEYGLRDQLEGQVNLRGDDNSIGSRAGNGFGVHGTVKCDSCRRRKQKCLFSDPAKPCELCLKHGLQCGGKGKPSKTKKWRDKEAERKKLYDDLKKYADKRLRNGESPHKIRAILNPDPMPAEPSGASPTSSFPSALSNIGEALPDGLSSASKDNLRLPTYTSGSGAAVRLASATDTHLDLLFDQPASNSAHFQHSLMNSPIDLNRPYQYLWLTDKGMGPPSSAEIPSAGIPDWWEGTNPLTDEVQSHPLWPILDDDFPDDRTTHNTTTDLGE